MAQNLTIELATDTWVLLTNADVTALTFQNVGQSNIVIMGTTSAVAPTDTNDGITYLPGFGESNKPLADLFPGIAAVRVYGYSPLGAGGVFVSHA